MAILAVAGILLGAALLMFGMATHAGGVIALGFGLLVLAMVFGLYVPGNRPDASNHLVGHHDHETGTRH
jgi:hypothetical protein